MVQADLLLECVGRCFWKNKNGKTVEELFPLPFYYIGLGCQKVCSPFSFGILHNSVLIK